MKRLSLALNDDAGMNAVCADVARLPAWIAEVGLSFQGDLADAARVAALLPGDLLGRLRSLCLHTTSDPDADIAAGRDADVLGGLTALTYLVWSPDEGFLSRPSSSLLSMRSLSPVIEGRGLVDVWVEVEVDAEVAAALMALPSLQRLRLIGPAPLPPGFDVVACLEARKAPLESLVFGERILLDWTPLLLLVDPSGRHRICRHLVVENKWTAPSDYDVSNGTGREITVTLKLTSNEDVARCHHLMGFFEYEMLHEYPLDVLNVQIEDCVSDGVPGVMEMLSQKMEMVFDRIDVNGVCFKTNALG